MLNQHIGKKAGSGVTKGKKHKGNIRLTHQSVVQGKKPMIIIYPTKRIGLVVPCFLWKTVAW